MTRRAVRLHQLRESLQVHTEQGLRHVRPCQLVFEDGRPSNVGLFVDRDSAMAWAREQGWELLEVTEVRLI